MVFIRCENRKTEKVRKGGKTLSYTLRTQYNLINVTLLKRSNKALGPHLKFLSGLKRHLNFLQFIKIPNFMAYLEYSPTRAHFRADQLHTTSAIRITLDN